LVFVVRNRDDLLDKVISFFERYPLLSNKQDSFQLFKKVVNFLKSGEHATLTGVKKILNFAYQMNGQGKYRKIDQGSLLNYLESSETIRRIPKKSGKI